MSPGTTWPATQRRRFCRHCNLHVYNLSDMPRAEAEAFVSQAEGRTCIRMFRREDGTVLTRDCPVGLRAVRQRLVRAVAALAGLLIALVSGTVFAGRLKNLAIPGLGRPADAYSEWIEPGSTQRRRDGCYDACCRYKAKSLSKSTNWHRKNPRSRSRRPSSSRKSPSDWLGRCGLAPHWRGRGSCRAARLGRSLALPALVNYQQLKPHLAPSRYQT